jgi:hypothetical protein
MGVMMGLLGVLGVFFEEFAVLTSCYSSFTSPFTFHLSPFTFHLSTDSKTEIAFRYDIASTDV